MVVRFPVINNWQTSRLLYANAMVPRTTYDYLATLQYRMDTWSQKIVYVTDGRQQLHFQQLFKIFGRWQNAASVQLEHVWFGSILGPDGKPFKTRSGDTVRLADLLNEAEERAFALVSEESGSY